ASIAAAGGDACSASDIVGPDVGGHRVLGGKRQRLCRDTDGSNDRANRALKVVGAQAKAGRRSVSRVWSGWDGQATRGRQRAIVIHKGCITRRASRSRRDEGVVIGRRVDVERIRIEGGSRGNGRRSQ